MFLNRFFIVLFTIFSTVWAGQLLGQEIVVNKLEVSPTSEKDNSSIVIDTIKIDSLKKKSNSAIEDIVDYKAKKYVKMNNKKKLVTLYDEAEVKYQDIEIKSGKIVIDFNKSQVFAGTIPDSIGKAHQFPYFKQAENVVEPDSMLFNFKSKKALSWNSLTKQGEFLVIGEKAKRENDSLYFMQNAKFTTSEDFEDPEYYFLARKIKMVPKKKIVTGVVNMAIYDVPTPIGLPFSFFPMTTTSQSGIIMPAPVETERQGFSLQNGGLYLALSDRYDLTLTGDYYTNGSYAIRTQSDYAFRYKFRGTLNFRYENLINGEKGFPDYTKSKIYNIQWSHSQDPKNSPNSRLSASVNLGSSTFFQQSLNQINVGAALNNNLSSSVSYSRTFQSVPQVNLTVTATHNQNSQTQQINMTLPTLQLNVDRVFPFAPKDGAKKGFIKNINLQYSVRGENRFQTTDSLFFTSEMFRDAKTGFQHTIPLSTNFKIFKYFSASASANYNETWVFKTIERSYNESFGRVQDREINGFDAFRTYNFSSSIGTTIYGTFNFGEDKNFQSLRHVMRPNVSFNYAPSFENYYDEYVVDPVSEPIKRARYSRFEGGLYGEPSLGFSKNLGFNLSNTFEAKVRDKDKPDGDPKKIMLLNQLNFSSGYNLAADSLRINPISMSGGTSIFDNKMNINFSTTMDPYALNQRNERIAKFNIQNGGSLLRLTAANLNLSYSITNRNKSEKANSNNRQGIQNGGREDDLFGRSTDLGDSRNTQFDEKKENENEIEEFYNAKLPFDINFAYTVTYGNARRENTIVGQSLMVSANMDLTPKWRIGGSSGYDFANNGVTFTQLRFERDLLSWRMDFNWSPFGQNKFWGFFIGIKSGALSDIKWEKRKVPDRRLR